MLKKLSLITFAFIGVFTLAYGVFAQDNNDVKSQPQDLSLSTLMGGEDEPARPEPKPLDESLFVIPEGATAAEFSL